MMPRLLVGILVFEGLCLLRLLLECVTGFFCGKFAEDLVVGVDQHSLVDREN